MSRTCPRLDVELLEPERAPPGRVVEEGARHVERLGGVRQLQPRLRRTSHVGPDARQATRRKTGGRSFSGVRSRVQDGCAHTDVPLRMCHYGCATTDVHTRMCQYTDVHTRLCTGCASPGQTCVACLRSKSLARSTGGSPAKESSATPNGREVRGRVQFSFRAAGGEESGGAPDGLNV